MYLSKYNKRVGWTEKHTMFSYYLVVINSRYFLFVCVCIYNIKFLVDVFRRGRVTHIISSYS